ncbi:MAG: hypothetical protein R3F37_07840 [Candidatus Competibacteraceae bacterium]
MSDQLHILKMVASRLEQVGIAYMVSGSTAMNYYAQPRLTRDIDIVVELEPTDSERLVALFSTDFYIDGEIVQTAISNQSLFNIIHSELIVKVDFIVRKDMPYRNTEFPKAPSPHHLGRHEVVVGQPGRSIAVEDGMGQRQSIRIATPRRA